MHLQAYRGWEVAITSKQPPSMKLTSQLSLKYQNILNEVDYPQLIQMSLRKIQKCAFQAKIDPI